MYSGITLHNYDIIIKNPVGQNQMMKFEHGEWVAKFVSEWERIILNKKIKKVKDVKEQATINSNFYGHFNFGSTPVVLTDEEFKAGKQGYIFAPYIMAESITSIELPSYMIAKMRRDTLKKKLQKIKNIK